jgi:cell division protein FtsI/penicillin-binding protein 2
MDGMPPIFSRVTPVRHLRVVSLTATAVLAACLVGCTATPPDPQEATRALAEALATAEFADVPLAAGTAAAVEEELAAITAGLGAATREVTLVAVDEVEDEQGVPAAVAELTVTWDLDGPGPAEPDWSYSTQATLVLDDETDPPEWVADWAPSVLHPDLEPGQTLVSERVQPPRADIVGGTGTPLVTARQVQRVGIDKVQLGGADGRASARALAEVVGVDGEAYAARVAAAGEQAFVEAIVLREADAEPLRPSLEAIPGARLLSDSLPLPPTREFARPLLGTVGEATAEIVEASGGAIVAGDLVGVSGLQAAYDTRLRGLPGFTVRIRTEDGSPGDALVSRGPAAGEPLALTLDPGVQQLADDLLADIASPSALVALRPSTGEVLAIASGPAGDGYSTATLGQYAPGSVFKLVTSLALLRAGQTPSSTLPCTETITIDGKAFTNYSDFPPSALGQISLTRALAESCNTAFVSQVDAVDDETLADAAASLAVGGWPDLGFDAFPGSVGTAQSRVDQAASMIGQGTVLLSPLAAATMAASATGGPVLPRLVLDAPVGTVPGTAVTAAESADLLSLMRTAVEQGTAEVLADVPGPPVAGKTGTAEYGTEVPPDTHGWMVAVQGDVAAAVFVEDAESGSATAGPILASFLAALPSATTG